MCTLYDGGRRQRIDVTRKPIYSGGQNLILHEARIVAIDPKLNALLAAARAGSREALGRALEECRRYLLHIAEAELDADLRRKGGASDLVQETFVDAQRLFDRFEGQCDAELQAWLRQLLLYNLAGFTRQFRTRMRSADKESPILGLHSSLGMDLPASLNTPSAVVRGAEDNAALDAALAKLSAEYRQVLQLRYEQNLTFEEIGRQMDRTANAARKLWTRAIRELQERMNANDEA